jgi:deoxycytidylate deaminase
MKNDPASLGFLPDNMVKVLSVHAEIDAIRKCSDPRGAILYVSRQRRTGVGMSRPCSRCELAIAKAGIKTVIYTIDE